MYYKKECRTHRSIQIRMINFSIWTYAQGKWIKKITKLSKKEEEKVIAMQGLE